MHLLKTDRVLIIFRNSMSNQYFWCKILPRYFGVFISYFEGDDASPKFTVRKGMYTGKKCDKRAL